MPRDAAFHVYQWDPRAVTVPPVPRPVSQPLTLGALVCIACRGLAGWHDHFGSDECPGLVTPVGRDATLAGSDPPGPDGATRPAR